MQRLLEKQKKLEMQAAKQQQLQAEELKNQSTKQTNKAEKSNAIVDSRESRIQKFETAFLFCFFLSLSLAAA